MLLLLMLLAIVILIVLITWIKLNPFISLIVTSIGVGLAAGMPLFSSKNAPSVIDSVKNGLGSTLGFLAIVLGLGTMLGKMMAESGGAERIAKTLIASFGERNVHWAMMVVAFFVGIPVFFQVGFVLLIPLVFTIAVETGMSLVTVGIPLVAGLSIVHGLVPPHPAAMAAVGIYGANVGRTIFLALLVGLPSAIIAGPLYGKWIGKRIVKTVPPDIHEQLIQKTEERPLPGFANTMITILLPVFLMLLATLADVRLPAASEARHALDFIGDPVVALLIATVYSFISLGLMQGIKHDAILKFTNECLAPTATILLVIGAGGAFNQVLKDSGVGAYIAQLAKASVFSPIILAWTIAALIRVATGSATVSMMTSAGIVAPIAAASPGTDLELLTLATGAGSLILSHVNDSGFWMIKEYFGMSLKETFLTWTAMETILSVVALVFILVVDVVI